MPRKSGQKTRRRWRPLQVKDRNAATARAAARRILTSVVDLDRLRGGPPGLARWLRERSEYAAIPGSEPIPWRASNPQLYDAIDHSPIDPHYFFQDVWAAQRVAELSPAMHIDVGSRIDLVGFLTAITQVTFVDIRPFLEDVEGLTGVTGSVLDMPFSDASVESLSCLHVAEHIGLGRYGDPLDPMGTHKAMAELQRVLAPGGQLLFSGPVGQERTFFNAHRIQPPSRVIDAFSELDLVEFSGTDDAGRFGRFRDPAEFERATYALGLFCFRRPR